MPPVMGVPQDGEYASDDLPDKPAFAAYATDSGLHRDGSSGSNDSSDSQQSLNRRPLPRNKSSVDRLRQIAIMETLPQGSVAGPSSRAPSPSSSHFPSAPSGASEAGSSSRAASPQPSSYGHHTSSSRQNMASSPLSSGSGFPRPYSVSSMSMSSRHHLALPPAGGAPHQRSMQLQMPAPLGAPLPGSGSMNGRPSSEVDFGTFGGYASRRSSDWGSSQTLDAQRRPRPRSDISE